MAIKRRTSEILVELKNYIEANPGTLRSRIAVDCRVNALILKTYLEAMQQKGIIKIKGVGGKDGKRHYVTRRGLNL